MAIFTIILLKVIFMLAGTFAAVWLLGSLFSTKNQENCIISLKELAVKTNPGWMLQLTDKIGQKITQNDEKEQTEHVLYFPDKYKKEDVFNFFTMLYELDLVSANRTESIQKKQFVLPQLPKDICGSLLKLQDYIVQPDDMISEEYSAKKNDFATRWRLNGIFVTALAICPKTKKLFIGYNDGQISSCDSIEKYEPYDVRDNGKITQIDEIDLTASANYKKAIRSLLVDAERNVLCIEGSSNISLYDVAKNECVTSIPAYRSTYQPRNIILHSDTGKLFWSESSQTCQYFLSCYNFKDGSVVKSPIEQLQIDCVIDLTIASDVLYVSSSGGIGRLQIKDDVINTPLEPLCKGTHIYSCAVDSSNFSPNLITCTSVSGDIYSIKQFADIDGKELIRDKIYNTPSIPKIKYNKKRDTILVTSRDSIYEFDKSTGDRRNQINTRRWTLPGSFDLDGKQSTIITNALYDYSLDNPLNRYDFPANHFETTFVDWFAAEQKKLQNKKL